MGGLKFTMTLPAEGGNTHCGTYDTVCDGEGAHIVRVPDVGNIVTVSSQSKIEDAVTIPEDVKAAAYEAMKTVDGLGALGVISRAILAERQRCADVADSFTPGGERYEFGNDTATADAIRKAILA